MKHMDSQPESGTQLQTDAQPEAAVQPEKDIGTEAAPELETGAQAQIATQQGTVTPPEIKLRCFQGNPAPSIVVDGWRRLARLPEEARSDFWNLLQPALTLPNNPANEQLLKEFCANHELAETDVIAALGSCDWLLRQASALNLDRAAFQQDLVALSMGDPGGGDFLLPHFDEAKGVLRQQIILESLADHGKVIVGLDWRIDDVSASDRGAALNTKVVLLTLRYRDGNRQERITFQLTPEAVKELKQFCDRFSM